MTAGEQDQSRGSAGAVDGEALEPLAEVVAFSPEDEELVAKVRDRDAEGTRDIDARNDRGTTSGSAERC